MTIPKPILKSLEEGKIKYQVVEHRKVFTAFDKAATLHVDPKHVVKTAVFQAGTKRHVLVLVPAHKHINIAKVKAAVNAWLKKRSERPEQKIGFATEQWMKKHLSWAVGLTPPFPGILEMPILADNSLLKLSKLYINSGSYEASFLLNQANFKKILGADLIKGSFAK